MLQFCALVILLFGFFLVLGLPAAVRLSQTMADARLARGWVLLAPSIGVMLYLSSATMLHAIGVSGAALLYAALLLSMALLIAFDRSGTYRLLSLLLVVIVIVVVAVALSSVDVDHAGLDYFPLTNDDTFSYLGLIDQIRSTGWVRPLITYPAGFQPLIAHAIDSRAPGAVLVADIADAFSLKSHTAFFLVQRLTIPVVATGATGVVLLATGSIWAACLCFVALICGNGVFYQVLQQFNSSSMGTIVGVVTLASLVWASSPERSYREAVAGWGIAGFSVGTMAVTSLEQHTFYLIACGAVFAAALFLRPCRKRFIGFGVAFAAGFFLPSFWIIARIWQITAGQYLSTAGDMNAAVLARPSFLYFMSGVTFFLPPKMSGHPVPLAICAVATVAVFIAATAYLLWKSPGNNGALVLGLFGLVLLSLEALLYGLRIGYGLMKIADYFAFLSAVSTSVAAAMVASSSRLRAAISFAVLTFCVFAAIQKITIFKFYRAETEKIALPETFNSAHNSEPAGLTMEQFNLFLYENRMVAAPIVVKPGRSNRFGMP
jgi:hypothetical protein